MIGTNLIPSVFEPLPILLQNLLRKDISCYSILGNAYFYYTIYSLYESAISNLLVVETLRHGTNPVNFCLIQMKGLDPKAGALQHGESKLGEGLGARPVSDCIEHVFVWKDTEFQLDTTDQSFVSSFKTHLAKILCPKIYINISTTSLLSPKEDQTFLNKVLRTGALIGGIAMMPLVPTLKFHYNSQEIPKVFEDDPSMQDTAYRTNKLLPPWRLGMTGSLISGLNQDLLGRLKQAPFRPILGAIQLISALALTSHLVCPALLPTALTVHNLYLAAFAVSLTTF